VTKLPILPTARRRHACALLFTLTLAPVAASAQDVPAQPKQLAADACSPEERQKTVPAPPGQTQQAPAAEPRENLSNKLARTDGVLCPPPGVDPDIHEPPPGGGRTPVIPPPGSPGGDPATRPK
jgi:hypothetical protein